MGITKAVIPAAGLGTRFLPATKATPKEMLPVVDKPAIQYVVEEAAAAGLSDVLMIVGRNKEPLIDHFDHAWEVEHLLAERGDHARLELVRHPTSVATVHFVRQGEALGLGHAVACAEQHVGDQPFAVLLGDDLIDERDPLLPRMLAAQQQLGGSVIALMEVPADQIQLYGCAAIEAASGDGVVHVTDLVEKPAPGTAPSSMAVIGRYVLHPAVFDALRVTKPGRGGEIQLTDALHKLMSISPADGGGVHGVVFSGRRYDTGDKLDYLKAVVRLAADRPDLGPEFTEWLSEFTASRLEQASR